MDLDAALKKIRLQIKFGRVVEAGQALDGLREQFKGSASEKTILQIYALEHLRERDAYREAIPALQRLLQLDIEDDIRAQATDFLRLSIYQENLLPREPDLSTP